MKYLHMSQAEIIIFIMVMTVPYMLHTAPSNYLIHQFQYESWLKNMAKNRE